MIGGCILEFDDLEHRCWRLHIEGANNFHQAGNIRLHFRENEGVGRLIGEQAALSGNQGGEQAADFIGIGILQRDELGDKGVAIEGWLICTVNGSGECFLLHHPRRDDFVDGALRHNRESLYFKNGEKNVIGFRTVDRTRRNDGDFATYFFINEKVLVGQITHQIDDLAQVDIFKIQQNVLLRRWRVVRGAGRFRRCRFRRRCRWCEARSFVFPQTGRRGRPGRHQDGNPGHRQDEN